jgi:CheY-like chemotaxis protein
LSKILIADQNRDFWDLAVFALRFAGHEAVGVSDGEECLRIAKQTKPDLILIDDNLPRLDVDTAAIRVVLMHSTEQHLATHTPGGDGEEEMIIKPVDNIDQLVRQVNSLLRMRNPARTK